MTLSKLLDSDATLGGKGAPIMAKIKCLEFIGNKECAIYCIIEFVE